METSRLSGSAPDAATGDSDVLTVVDEEFRNLYDVPFITVNMIDGWIVAEVQCSENELATQSRIQEAKEVARQYGQRLFARHVSDIAYPELEGVDFGSITLQFMPDGGL